MGIWKDIVNHEFTQPALSGAEREFTQRHKEEFRIQNREGKILATDFTDYSDYFKLGSLPRLRYGWRLC